MSFFDELQRRNVVRVGVAYIVASWVFLQVADLVFDAINAPDWVLQAMLFLAVLGFIAAMIIAWAYEVTPEGIKREKDVVRDESITHQTAARLNKLTIALVVAGVAVVAIDRLVPETGELASKTSSEQIAEQAPKTNVQPEAQTPPKIASEPSVAVLPFVNMSSDPEQEFFSDGISEEILNVLTRIPNLKVAARTSSFQFKGQNQDVADIARQLKVNHILEGSVRKAGNQLRITAQLVEAESGFHLWSDTFDRELKDVFAIQDEIAGAIAGELRSRLTDESLAHSQEVNLEAYELYLKGRGLVATRDVDELLEGLELLKAAVEIEPGYAAALATIAKAYVVMPYFTDQFPTLEMREQARDWADKALEIEPDNSEALSVKGVVLNESDLDVEGALALLEKAVRSNPGNVAANNFLGDVYFRSGNVDKAIQYESRAAELDPLAPVHLSDLAFAHWLNGDYDKALEFANRALELSPNFANAHQTVMESWWVLGDLEKLERAVASAFTSGDSRSGRSLGLIEVIPLAKGDPEPYINTLINDFELAKAGQRDAISVAFRAVKIGEFDIAGEMLLQALKERDGTWLFPMYVRLPEQAPDSEPWQEFWSLPGPKSLAEIRRANGLKPHYPTFGEAAK